VQVDESAEDTAGAKRHHSHTGKSTCFLRLLVNDIAIENK